MSESGRDLSWPQRLTFATPQIGVGISGTIMASWLTFFLVPPEEELQGGRVALIGAGAYIALELWGKLVDAFADPLVGHWSDRTRSRWGRRIPFILFGGAVIKYDDMGGFTRGFANTLVPARWAYESIVHAERSGGRGFDQNPEEQVDEMKGKLEDMKSTVEDLASENEQLRRGGSPRRTEIDSEEEDEEETAFNKDSFLPFAKDQRGFRQTQWDKNILLGFFALMVMMILLTVGTHQRLRKRG